MVPSQAMEAPLAGGSIIYKPAASGYIGGLLPNNTWDGAIGEVIRHEFDMIASPLLPNYERNMAVDLSEFLWDASHATIQRKAQVQPDIAGFIKPFSATTWLSVLATFVAFVICFILTFKMREILSPRPSSK
ncbi:glutamate receptor U1-like [Hyalella azteca]|uniref:Glutamate receptor U1-like n=1 Tax=Hyalella azteca TaxID=294128 RepID=A0A8B7PJL3_HYAAZ|nr:glutamate receptor U1-like [Hyalella azteca]